MRHSITLLLTILLLTLFFGASNSGVQNNHKMKLNAGIVTPNLQETKAFYTDVLGFGVSFESDFYLLLHTPGGEEEISFLLPDLPNQQPLFRPAFTGQGVYLTIEMDDVDGFYESVKLPSLTPMA